MTWLCRALCGLIYPGNKDKLYLKISEIPQPDFFPYKVAHLKIAQVAFQGMKESSSGHAWRHCNTHPNPTSGSRQPCWGAEGCHSPRALDLKWLLYSGVSKAELANLLMDAQLIPVKEVCQGSLNQVLNWKKSNTSNSSWPAQLMKCLVLGQPQCCFHCTLTELCHISTALTHTWHPVPLTLSGLWSHWEMPSCGLTTGQPHWFTHAKHPSPDLENLSCHHVCAT